MSGKLKMIIGVIVTATLVSCVWGFIMYNKTKEITEKFEGEISQLTATLDALGPNIDCYTVTEEYVNHVDGNTTGQIIENNALQVISVPSSLVGETYVTDPSKIVGRYWKVNVHPGTPITSDLVMAEKYDDTLRDVDIACDSWVVGMRPGDYVDLRFTLPFGQDYVVLTHKRVQSIGTKTIKLFLTEEELHTYQSVVVDHYLNQSNGSRLYLTKYIEPGVQKVATTYYAPSDAVKTMMLSDPNVVSKAEIKIKSAFRPAIDAALNQFIDESVTLKSQTGNISGGRSSYNGYVSSDYNQNAQAANNASKEDDTYEEENQKIVLEDEVEETVAETAPVETGSVVYEEETPAPVETEVALEESSEAATEETAEESLPSSYESLPAETAPEVVG